MKFLLSLLSLLLLVIGHYSFSKRAESNPPSELPKRYIKKIDRAVSFIGLGTVELGRAWGIAGEESLHPSESVAQAVLLQALRNNITVIDTASSYGLSEERIGRYIPRTAYNYLLITKPGEHNIKANDPRCEQKAYDEIYCAKPAADYDFSREAIFQDVHESLQKLKTDKLDIVLLHLDNKTAIEVLKKGEAVKALQELKALGKLSFIGVSVNGEPAQYAIDMDLFDVIEMEYSLINQRNKPYIDAAYAKGMGIIIRGGLGTGLLTPYVKQHIDDPNLPYGPKIRALLELTHQDYNQLTSLALAFLYQDPHISSVIIGADRPEYIDKDIKLLKEFKDESLLEKAKAILQHYETPDFFTENMGEYFFNKES
ncbi:putative aldo/keto reductase family protein [Legionella busanensis]|uniref:Putative aldo/keto reductase family protein n=1 Tax=Legionella busanensis TaxID=190655 RepID=A0A378JHD7_9GAMM|nr:aldo/keto reductase [Legionella busanensis]STX50201.1 putative aldo/keto reductase family protein [Legionella busanensis]